MCVASKSKKFFRLKYVYTYAYMCIHVYTNGKRERIYLIWKINREILLSEFFIPSICHVMLRIKDEKTRS